MSLNLDRPSIVEIDYEKLADAIASAIDTLNTGITSVPPFLIGDGQNTKIILNHNLGTKRFAAITLRVLNNGMYLFANQPIAVNENNLEFNFSTAPGINSIEVILAPIS